MTIGLLCHRKISHDTTGTGENNLKVLLMNCTPRADLAVIDHKNVSRDVASLDPGARSNSKLITTRVWVDWLIGWQGADRAFRRAQSLRSTLLPASNCCLRWKTRSFVETIPSDPTQRNSSAFYQIVLFLNNFLDDTAVRLDF